MEQQETARGFFFHSTFTKATLLHFLFTTCLLHLTQIYELQHLNLEQISECKCSEKHNNITKDAVSADIIVCLCYCAIEKLEHDLVLSPFEFFFF